MSVTILKRDDGPTRRQLAFESALMKGIDDYGRKQEKNAMLAREEKKEATQRERNLNLAATQFAQQRAQQGMETTPEQAQAYKAAIDSGDAGSLKSIFGDTATMAKEQRSYDRDQKRLDREAKRQSQGLDAQYKQAQIRKLSKEAGPKTAKDILSGMGAEAKSKVGSVVSGMQALNKVNESLDQGFGPEYVDSNTPLIGNFVSDNPFTENQRTLSEVIGRLQSGGAINEDEGKRFVDMGPRPGDDPATQRRKIENQREFLKNKLTAFGLRPEQLNEAGFDYQPYESMQDRNKKFMASAPPGFQAPGMPTDAPIPFNPGAGQIPGAFNMEAVASDPQMQKQLVSPERMQARQSRLQELRAKAGQR